MKRLTKKHYAIIYYALNLSLDNKSEKMYNLINEIKDNIYDKTTEKLLDKYYDRLNEDLEIENF